VKSHAKASTAGSNSGPSPSLGSLRRPGILVALVLLAAACLIPGSALAAETRPPVEAFGPDGTSGTNFEFPEALAFDQGNERLYALDQEAALIHGFDASTPGTYTPLGGSFPLTATGASSFGIDDLAVDSASHDIFFLAEFGVSLAGYDSTGAPLGGNFPITSFGDPCGAAVDPSGNIWVGDYGTKTVKEYDSAGNSIDSVDVSANGNPCHIAFDSEANLYVAFYFGATWKYTAASGYTSATEVDPTTSTAAPLAVDRASDDLYVVHESHVSVYDAGGAFLYEFGGSVSGAQYTGVAIDQASDRAYVSDAGNKVVQVFGPAVPLPGVLTEDADAVTTTLATLHATVNPEGEQLTDCHFDFVPASQFAVDQYESVTPAEQAPCVPAAASIPHDSSSHAVKADISGLTANTSYHFRLVASTAEGTADGADRTFTTAIGAPVIAVVKVEAVGTADATLSAKINPKGAKTTYHVEYGTTTSYGQSSAESAPIGFQSDDSAHSVSVHIGGLQPGTAYHFRFVATSIVGKAEGTDASFATYPTTPPLGSCPNDQFRSGFGARLSDCRAYEQVTPTDKHGANAPGGRGIDQASSSGGGVTFYLISGLPTSGGSSTFSAFVASRAAGGWSSDGLLPLLEPGRQAFVVGWSDDLATTLVAGDTLAGAALYLRDSDTAAYQVVATGPRELGQASLDGYATDTSHLIFEAQAALLPGAVAGQWNLYDLNHGALTLPGRIPVSPATSCDDSGGGPACVPAPQGVFAGNSGNGNFEGGGYSAHNAISKDGSKVFFTDRASRQIYVREDGTKSTQVSASQKTNGTGPGGTDPLGPKPAEFREATAEGAHTFFTSPEELTDDAKTGAGSALGRANLDGSSAEQSFISIPEAAGGIAVDGSHIYWTNPKAGTIARANLDGTSPNQSFITGASKPTAVAVNGSHIYWTNSASGANGAGTIGRANLDGTSPEQSFITGASNPQGIAVDGSFIYWANAGTTAATRAIGRANLDGTSPNQSFVAVTGLSGPSGVAVNASFIYWTNPGDGETFSNSIGRANLDGTSPNQSFVNTLIDPGALTLNGSFLYWADKKAGFSGQGIGRVKLDGSELSRIFIDTLEPQGVAVDGAHLYWGNSSNDTGNDLYRYDSASGDLTDLSADSNAADPRVADVQGFLGASADGSYAYFVANGVLAPGAQPGGVSTTNLYVSHAGAITFLAQLESRQSFPDTLNWETTYNKISRVADDGTLVFASERLVDLSGHDHGNACGNGGGGVPCTEFYRYTPSDEELNCVTCTPTGTPPSGGADLAIIASFYYQGPGTTILSRNLSADGKRFFFETPDVLLPSDTNGVGDVYEWEAKGSGSCESESQDGGCIYLISSGTSPVPSHFLDASADGDHAFFFTSQQLVPGDHDELVDVYDAGVGGGLASQHTLAPPTCAGAACQANPAPPPDQPASSAVFSGPGNAHKSPKARKCPKGKRQVRRAGKVRCQKAHKAKQRKRHDNRGGSK
jgi:hypothetical protein